MNLLEVACKSHSKISSFKFLLVLDVGIRILVSYTKNLCSNTSDGFLGIQLCTCSERSIVLLLFVIFLQSIFISIKYQYAGQFFWSCFMRRSVVISEFELLDLYFTQYSMSYLGHTCIFSFFKVLTWHRPCIMSWICKKSNKSKSVFVCFTFGFCGLFQINS